LPAPRIRLRRRAREWLALLLLLAPFASQALHPAAPLAAVGGRPSGAALGITQGDASDAAPAHDADGCPLCRATAQTRLGLRVLHAAGAPIPDASDQRLRPTGPLRNRAAPELGSARSRAPPASPLLQNA
jgi:hypothetical protein